MPSPAPSRWRWEEAFWERGFLRVAGLDEAGRGPLAGPVLAAAVILPRDFREEIPLRDSKKMTPKARQEAFSYLAAYPGVEVGVGQADVATIDRINILQATRAAMRSALASLPQPSTALLIDGLKLPETGLPQRRLYRGEDQSISIAAASIIAKVTRDRIMVGQDEAYPEYGFARHKGYGTREHLAALARLGPCPLHRRSFGPVRDRVLAEPSS